MFYSHVLDHRVPRVFYFIVGLLSLQYKAIIFWHEPEVVENSKTPFFCITLQEVESVLRLPLNFRQHNWVKNNTCEVRGTVPGT